MQTPYSDPFQSPTFFSRERRKERMLKFLETFERRSWRCASEIPFLLPLPKSDLHEQSVFVSADSEE